MLLLKIWISYAIPDIPSWLATEMAKIEWRRREGEKILHGFQFSNGSSLDTVDKAVQTEDSGALIPPAEYSNTRLRQKVTSL